MGTVTNRQPVDRETIVNMQRRLEQVIERLENTRGQVNGRLDNLVQQLQALGIAVTRPQGPGR